MESRKRNAQNALDHVRSVWSKLHVGQTKGRKLGRCQAMLPRFRMQVLEIMCSHCPRCNSISGCHEATYDEEGGRLEVCNDVWERPLICDYCWPDVEM